MKHQIKQQDKKEKSIYAKKMRKEERKCKIGKINV
jgi:hypothetical protein